MCRRMCLSAAPLASDMAKDRQCVFKFANKTNERTNETKRNETKRNETKTKPKLNSLAIPISTFCLLFQSIKNQVSQGTMQMPRVFCKCLRLDQSIHMSEKKKTNKNFFHTRKLFSRVISLIIQGRS